MPFAHNEKSDICIILLVCIKLMTKVLKMFFYPDDFDKIMQLFSPVAYVLGFLWHAYEFVI